ARVTLTSGRHSASPQEEAPMMTSAPAKFVTLGHPSYLWRRGQQRRLDLVRRYVPLEGQCILDVGCGLGVYVTHLRQLSDEVYGIDIDSEKVEIASRTLPNISHAAAEALPFPNDRFDVILLHEVIEHVASDAQ